MRDPAAALRFEADRVVRDLRMPLDEQHFLRSELARCWCSEGRLVPYEILSEERVESVRLPFVTQPSEWTDAQFLAAASLTLTLQRQAVEGGFDMKDGSAWNVLFDGCRPTFCDLLSFERLTEQRWWALGQFARHFIVPLLVSRRKGLRAGEIHAVWRDGMPADKARSLLGWPALLSRYGPLLVSARAGAHSSVDAVPETVDRVLDPTGIQQFRQRLHATLEWQLNGLSETESRRGPGWSDYEGDRPHYGGASLDGKRATVARWLQELAPDWVLDLGCNTGEFSRLSLARGACVIALDADHDSVQRLFLAHPGETRLYPLVAPLDDLHGARGWAAQEHAGLGDRLTASADLVLMLALIHHLAIGCAVPLEQVARFAFRCTRHALVVEILNEDDPQLQALCRQRRRDPGEFSVRRQREAFMAAGFRLGAEQRLDGAARSLLLLIK